MAKKKTRSDTDSDSSTCSASEIIETLRLPSPQKAYTCTSFDVDIIYAGNSEVTAQSPTQSMK